ncbi:MAG: hypothetical protein ACRD3F_10130 [Acidobacteriaceae bacterium]
MRIMRGCSSFVFLLLLISSTSLACAQAGPPFQTDDAVPVNYGHYEFYVFGLADGTPVEMDADAPAVEFNWGVYPKVQLHAIVPGGVTAPMNHPAYAPDGQGPVTLGLGDIELGVKYGFITETKHRPQIGSFPLIEIPHDDKPSYLLPVWVSKSVGQWILDGGAGYVVNPQEGARNYPYGGFLLQHPATKKLDLGVEIFSHGRTDQDVAVSQSSTMIDAGGYYHFKSPGLQLLFAYGHSIAGQTENYAYLGLYKTWGTDKKKH